MRPRAWGETVAGMYDGAREREAVLDKYCGSSVFGGEWVRSRTIVRDVAGTIANLLKGQDIDVMRSAGHEARRHASTERKS